jgi:hypothetical protein
MAIKKVTALGKKIEEDYLESTIKGIEALDNNLFNFSKEIDKGFDSIKLDDLDYFWHRLYKINKDIEDLKARAKEVLVDVESMENVKKNFK